MMIVVFETRHLNHIEVYTHAFFFKFYFFIFMILWSRPQILGHCANKYCLSKRRIIGHAQWLMTLMDKFIIFLAYKKVTISYSIFKPKA